MPLGVSELDMRDYTAVSDNGTAVDVADTFQNDYLCGPRAVDFLASAIAGPVHAHAVADQPALEPCEGQPANTGARCPPEPSPFDLGSFDRPRSRSATTRRSIRPSGAAADAYWQRELESLQSVDRIVGRVIDLLRETGELGNTYVIFQSDNGLLHGEHDIFDKNVPWDRSVRIPLLIRGPGFLPGEIRSDLTANVDVPATIMDAAERRSPPGPSTATRCSASTGGASCCSSGSTARRAAPRRSPGGRSRRRAAGPTGASCSAGAATSTT